MEVVFRSEIVEGPVIVIDLGFPRVLSLTAQVTVTSAPEVVRKALLNDTSKGEGVLLHFKYLTDKRINLLYNQSINTTRLCMRTVFCETKIKNTCA